MKLIVYGSLSPDLRPYLSRKYSSVDYLEFLSAKDIVGFSDKLCDVLIVLTEAILEQLAQGPSQDEEEKEICHVYDFIVLALKHSRLVFLSSLLDSERRDLDILGKNRYSFLPYVVANRLLDCNRFIFIPEIGQKNELDPGEYRRRLMLNTSMTLAHTRSIVDHIDRGLYRLADPVKLIILDADNTLWGGIASEGDGDHLVLGGHSLLGDAYVYFQTVVMALKRRGFLLALCSKTNPQSTLRVLESHPECRLSVQDFVSVKCSWKPKSTAIKEIIAELNLREESALFIDDSQHEIDEVSLNLPAIKVLKLDESPYRRMQQLYSCIDLVGEDVSAESKLRTEYYIQGKIRSNSMAESRHNQDAYHNWLLSLDSRITATTYRHSKIPPRSEQLFIRSRQFNTSPTSVPYESESYIEFSLADRFGSMGTVAVVAYTEHDNLLEIDGMTVSCRAFNRYLEHYVFLWLARHAAERGKSSVVVKNLSQVPESYASSFFETLSFEDSQVMTSEIIKSFSRYESYILGVDK